MESTVKQNTNHGFRGNSNWPAPKLVAKSDESNRADQGNTIKANEYMDSDDILNQKMEIVAEMIKKSKCLVAYTGAGLSKASGISDYASKSAESVVKTKKITNSLEAQPTYAHQVLTAMERAGFLHHYVQQNHDGLPQKSGYPQEKINEIHGAWFDPSNPVVQFSGSLRSDLFKWMEDMEKKADMCLCLGTSLSGMNADRMANTPAKRSLKGNALGTVIINLQQTPLDAKCAVRVWAKLDDAFKLLAQKLNIKVKPITLKLPKGDVFTVPYNAKGEKDDSCEMTLDLRPGASITIPVKGAMNEGAVGKVIGKRDGHYELHLQEGKLQFAARRMFGAWWIDAAIRGVVDQLPVINTSPAVKKAASKGNSSKKAPVDQEMPDVDMLSMEDSTKLPSSINVVQSHTEIVNPGNQNSHKWGLQLGLKSQMFVASVTYELHPTFSPCVVKCTEAPFAISRLGWGTFDVDVEIELLPQYGSKKLKAVHSLTFKGEGQKCKVTKVPLA